MKGRKWIDRRMELYEILVKQPVLFETPSLPVPFSPVSLSFRILNSGPQRCLTNTFDPYEVERLGKGSVYSTSTTLLVYSVTGLLEISLTCHGAKIYLPETETYYYCNNHYSYFAL